MGLGDILKKLFPPSEDTRETGVQNKTLPKRNQVQQKEHKKTIQKKKKILEVAEPKSWYVKEL